MTDEERTVQLRKRACYRCAYVLKGEWEDKQRAHSRVFDTLVPIRYTFVGTSLKGGSYKERIVPCAYLRDLASFQFEKGRSLDDVANMLDRLLKVAIITKDEQKALDQDLRLRNRMPENWDPDTDSPFARFQAAGIEIKYHDYPKRTYKMKSVLQDPLHTEPNDSDFHDIDTIQILDGDTLEPIFAGDHAVPNDPVDEQTLEEFKAGFSDGGTDVQVFGNIIASGKNYKSPDEE